MPRVDHCGLTAYTALAFAQYLADPHVKFSFAYIHRVARVGVWNLRVDASPALHSLSEAAPPVMQTVLDFSLSDSVYARARLADVQAVNLWLGAGVMLEYALEDAQALLVSAGSRCDHSRDEIALGVAVPWWKGGCGARLLWVGRECLGSQQRR